MSDMFNLLFQSPYLLGIVSASLGSVVGCGVGFLLANRRDARVRTVETVYNLLSDDFTGKRLRMHEALKKHAGKMSELADPKNEETKDDRLEIVGIFNTYEMTCELLDRGDLDKKLFDRHLRQIMREDYIRVDQLFEKIENFSKAHLTDLRRPLCPKMRKLIGR